MSKRTVNPRTRKNSRTRLLMSLVVITLALLVGNLVFVNIHSAEDQIYIQRTADMRVLSQEIPQRVAEAMSGSNVAFDQLESAVADFEAAWNLIRYGETAYVDSGIGLKTGLPGRDLEISAKHPAAANLW